MPFYISCQFVLVVKKGYSVLFKRVGSTINGGLSVSVVTGDGSSEFLSHPISSIFIFFLLLYIVPSAFTC